MNGAGRTHTQTKILSFSTFLDERGEELEEVERTVFRLGGELKRVRQRVSDRFDALDRARSIYMTLLSQTAVEITVSLSQTWSEVMEEKGEGEWDGLGPCVLRTECGRPSLARS